MPAKRSASDCRLVAARLLVQSGSQPSSHTYTSTRTGVLRLAPLAAAGRLQILVVAYLRLTIPVSSL